MEDHELGLSLVELLEVERVVLFNLGRDRLAEGEIVVAVLQRVEVDLPEIGEEAFAFPGFGCKIHLLLIISFKREVASFGTPCPRGTCACGGPQTDSARWRRVPSAGRAASPPRSGS